MSQPSQPEEVDIRDRVSIYRDILFHMKNWFYVIKVLHI